MNGIDIGFMEIATRSDLPLQLDVGSLYFIKDEGNLVINHGDKIIEYGGVKAVAEALADLQLLHAADIADLNEKIQNIQLADVEEVKRELEAMKAIVENFAGGEELEAVKAQIQTVDSELAAFETETTKDITGLDLAIKLLQTLVAAVPGLISAVQDNVDAILERFPVGRISTIERNQSELRLALIDQGILIKLPPFGFTRPTAPIVTPMPATVFGMLFSNRGTPEAPTGTRVEPDPELPWNPYARFSPVPNGADYDIYLTALKAGYARDGYMGSIMSTPLTSTSDTVVCIISDGHTVVAILKTLTEVTVLPDVIAYVDKTGSAITDLQTRVARLEARVLALESQVDPSWPLPLPSAVRVDDGVTMGWAGLEFTFDLASRSMRIVCNDAETIYYAGADWTTDTAVIEFDAGRATGYLTDLTVPIPNGARLGLFLERGVDSVLLQLSGNSTSSSYTFSEV